jgi:outer membrane immunogenic protein
MKKLLLATTCLALSSIAAMAADLPLALPAKAPIMAAPVFSWTGCYVGAHIGGGTMTSSSEGTNTNQNGSGAVAGGQAGCNYQDGNWVFGVEGEGYWSGIRVHEGSSEGPFDNFSSNFKNTSDFTIAGRAGITFDRTLIYGKGGWAWGQFKMDETSICCGAGSSVFTSTQSGNLNGLLIGVGIEHALTRNWTIKVEYNYIAYGSRPLNYSFCSGGVCTTGLTTEASATKQIVKFGANYLFDIGGAPLVARY